MAQVNIAHTKSQAVVSDSLAFTVSVLCRDKSADLPKL